MTVTANGRTARATKRKFGFITKQGRYISGDVLDRYAHKNAHKDESKQLTDRFDERYNADGLLPPLYNPELLAQLLEINTYHYGACKTKARDTAGLGWSLLPVAGSEPEESAPPEELLRFFRSLPMPLAIMLDRAQLDYEAIGWGALELVREGYDPQAPLATLAHVPAHTLRAHRDGNRYAQIRGTKKRWFKAAGEEIDVHQGTGQVYRQGQLAPEVRATEIAWWQNYTPRSDYYGLPDVMPALGALHGDLARRDFNIAFFDNYGVPAYAVTITGDFDEGDIDEDTGQSDLEAAIEEHFRELAKHPHSVITLSLPTRSDGQEVNIEFHPLSVDIKEASFRLFRQDNRDEILAAHRVPPYRAGIAETGSLGGSTAREATEIYKRSVIEPRQMILEAIIDLHVLQRGFEITGWHFKLADIDNSDAKQDMDLLGVLVDKGAAWPDEMRAHFAARFGLDPKRELPGAEAPAEESSEESAA